MATWNSVYLKSTYHVLGWMAFFSWTIGFYPQILLNFQRKSVVGLNFDFVVLNLTKHSSYLIYNAALYFSPEIQRQYHEKYGYGEAFMNFSRKSTIGWSIGFVLLDLSGGLLNFAQMAAQSIDQGTMINFYGNVGKTLLSLVVVFFDLLFIIQHYVFYPGAKKETLLIDRLRSPRRMLEKQGSFKFLHQSLVVNRLRNLLAYCRQSHSDHIIRNFQYSQEQTGP